MKRSTVMKRAFLIALIATAVASAQSRDIYKLSRYDDRVEELLAKMTLDEKVGQLIQYDWNMFRRERAGVGPRLAERVKSGQVGSVMNVTELEMIRELQRIAKEDTRLGIPLIIATDVIHGYKTIFPIPLAEAASWDLDAIEKSAAVAASEASAAGITWTFAPMVDIARDARWGRVMEGAGEDPYLGSLIAAARVRGFQGKDLAAKDTIVACVKHYAAYGAADAGREYNTVDMSMQRLWNVYLPPFKAAVDAGVGTLMHAYNELNGVPASCDSYLIRDVLKGKWQFRGFTLSDYGSYPELIQHGFAVDTRQAAELLIKAGADMEMQSGIYRANLDSLVKEGRVDESLLDDAVGRILRIKFALGLFDDPFGYCDGEREKKTILSSENVEAAYDMAAKSIVLLKNEGKLLPLGEDYSTIAVIGALANSKRDMLANWPAQGDPNDAVTVLEALRKKLGEEKQILFAPGYGKHGACTAQQISEAVATAAKTDLVILAVGEDADMSGECRSRAHIGLARDTDRLAAAMAGLKKPTIVLLMNGRPLAIKNVHDSFDTILETWFLGVQAGPAIVDCIIGKFSPSGKLPVTFPLAVGQAPIFYSQKNTGKPYVPGQEWGSRYIDVANEPLYPFGFGLTYTTFEYSDVNLSGTTMEANGSIDVCVTVANTGSRAGDEIVQLYIRDLVASRTRPLKELRGFKKVHIEPGQASDVEFTLTASDLAFYDASLEFRAEPGDFQVFIGPNSSETKQASFTLQ
jgi:beta-glucosidase